MRLESLSDHIFFNLSLLFIFPFPLFDSFEHVYFLSPQLALHPVDIPKGYQLFISIVIHDLGFDFIVEKVLHEADRVRIICNAVSFSLLRDHLSRVFRAKSTFYEVNEGNPLGKDDRHFLNLDLHLESRSIQHLAASLAEAEAIPDDGDEELGQRLCLKLTETWVALLELRFARREQLCLHIVEAICYDHHVSTIVDLLDIGTERPLEVLRSVCVQWVIKSVQVLLE